MPLVVGELGHRLEAADRVVFGTVWPAPMTIDHPVGRLQTMTEL